MAHDTNFLGAVFEVLTFEVLKIWDILSLNRNEQ